MDRENEKVSNYNTVQYILGEIEGWKDLAPFMVMKYVLEDIRNDINLLKYYFPEVDFSLVDINLVYDKLFNSDYNTKNENVFRREKRI